MIKQTSKQVFLFKVILGMILAIHAGGVIASIAEYPYLELGRFGRLIPGFIYTFFPLACVVIMQWLLLSDYLPKWWITLGLIGCMISATTVGIIFLFITYETHNSYTLEIGTFNAFVSGILLAFPQWFILRGKKRYLWILANSIGLTIHFIGWNAIIGIPVRSVFYFTFERIISLGIPVVPFGLMLGLYLYTYFYNSNHQQTVEDKNK